jgi:hypothetical protein
MNNQEIFEQLKSLAFNHSIPFCYSCYEKAPSGCCTKCGSDDLMRLLPEVGCEYGTDWIVEHILKTELEPFDMDQAFEDFVRECYPETSKIGWMEFDTVKLMKEMDPISWRCAQVDFESQAESEKNAVSFDAGFTFYSTAHIKSFLENYVSNANNVRNE